MADRKIVDYQTAIAILRQWTNRANREYGIQVPVRSSTAWATHNSVAWDSMGQLKKNELQFGAVAVEKFMTEGYSDYASTMHTVFGRWHGAEGVEALFALWVHEYAHALNAARGRFRDKHSEAWKVVVKELFIRWERELLAGVDGDLKRELWLGVEPVAGSWSLVGKDVLILAAPGREMRLIRSATVVIEGDQVLVESGTELLEFATADVKLL